MSLASELDGGEEGGITRIAGADDLPQIALSDEDIKLHADFLQMLDKKTGGECQWLHNHETADS